MEICVLHSDHAQDSGRILAALARNAMKDDLVLRLKPRKPADPLLRQLCVLESIPGVGNELARALFTHFGNVAAVASADILALCNVPGIGAGKAQVIYDVLHGAA